MAHLKVTICVIVLASTVLAKSMPDKVQKKSINAESDDVFLDKIASALLEDLHDNGISKKSIDANAADICQPQGFQLHQSGMIRSPLKNGVEEYPDNKNCQLTLTVASDYKIAITILEMDTEGGDNCDYDYLTIDDGTQDIPRYCGTLDDVDDQYKYVETSGNHVSLRFVSDNGISFAGFQLRYEMIPNDNTNTGPVSNHDHSICDGGILEDDSESVYSPTDSSGKYANNLDCSLTIQAPPNRVVLVTILSFDVEYQSNCNYDYLAVIDNAIGGRRMKLCGDMTTIEVTTVQSVSRTLALMFRTDGSDRFSGFSLFYEFIDDPSQTIDPNDPCTGVQVLTAQSGRIMSPGYETGSYENDKDCKWRIEAQSGRIVRLAFSGFALEAEGSCAYDSLTVHDGENDNAIVLEKLCGNNFPDDIYSTTNNLYLHFHTDHSHTFSGFSLNYDIIDIPPPEAVCHNKNVTSSGTTITSPGYDGEMGSYPNSASCNWTVTSSHDESITLTFTRLDLEAANCMNDYVAVYDGESQASGSLIGRYCGQISGAVARSTGKHMFIHFKSDARITHSGFEASITFEKKDPDEDKGYAGCVAERRPEVLTESEGIIRSPPGNGANYLNNQECHWRVQVPQGKLAAVEFLEFELEAAQYSSCIYDVVRIYDGPDQRSPLLASYCGTSLPVPVEGTSNELYMTFTSDYSVRKKGFIATYAAKDYTQTGGNSDEPPCGIPKIMPTLKIVGGEVAEKHAYPWQVSLGYVFGSSSFEHFCGGSVISKNWIITAAHCLVDDDGNLANIMNIGVKVGEHDQKEPNEPLEVLHRVGEIFVHENYNAETHENDIAVMRLTAPIEYTMAVQPVCLPRTGELEGMNCIISGWGETKGTAPGGNGDVLLFARVPIIDRGDCTQPDWYGTEMTDNMLCAGKAEGGKDTCQGDSGGPLVCRNSGQFTLYGITSWGYGCAVAKSPGIYVRVARYTPWISSKTNNAFQQSP